MSRSPSRGPNHNLYVYEPQQNLERGLQACRHLKIFLPPPPVVCADGRSGAVVPVLFCVALWFVLRGASCFGVFWCSLFSCFFSHFGVVASLQEEGAGLCASRAFVCFCPFSLPLGVGGWLRFVTVALPGLSINHFAERETGLSPQ